MELVVVYIVQANTSFFLFFIDMNKYNMGLSTSTKNDNSKSKLVKVYYSVVGIQITF